MSRDDITEFTGELQEYIAKSVAEPLLPEAGYDTILGLEQDGVLSAILVSKAKEEKPSVCDLRFISPLQCVPPGSGQTYTVELKKPTSCGGDFSTDDLDEFMQACARSVQSVEWLLDMSCVLAWTGTLKDLEDVKDMLANAEKLATASGSSAELKAMITKNLGIVKKILEGNVIPLGFALVRLSPSLAAKARKLERSIGKGDVPGVSMAPRSEFELLSQIE
jgi:hypothetical protein